MQPDLPHNPADRPYPAKRESTCAKLGRAPDTFVPRPIVDEPTVWYQICMTDDVPWAECTDPQWAPIFAEERSRGFLRLSGPCPRCDHPTTTDYTAVTLGGAGGTARETETVTMFCKCGHPHKGHPDNDVSCGAYWLTVTEL